MIFGRIMAYVGSEYGLVGHNIITKVFVGADIVAILTQATGGSMLVSSTQTTFSSADSQVWIQSGSGGSSSLKLGRTILIVGLAFQVVAFGIFMFIALAFDLKTRRSLGDKMTTIRPLIWAFYLSAALIIVRSIFRTIGGFNAQAWIWVFESTHVCVQSFQLSNSTLMSSKDMLLRMNGCSTSSILCWSS
jgi:hypothetical protein